jgi:Na+/H+ antiporter NhaD/arsenite permease-like protein
VFVVTVRAQESADAPRPSPSSRLLALAPVALTVVVLWAMMSRPDLAAAREPSTAAGAAVLVVFVLTFCALSLGLLDRLAAVALGAVACLVLGALLGFYQPPDALLYLWERHEPLVLLAGIRLTTELLVVSGLFDRLARRVVQRSRGASWQFTVGLCALTFALSLVLNNLATILVVIPLWLRAAESLELDPVPLVLGVVIASNLGGASTMVGDFPNMLIANETRFDFTAFLIHLAPVCLIQLGVLLLFLAPSCSSEPKEPRRVRAALEELGRAPIDEKVARRGLLILAGMVLGFVVCGWIGVAPGLVSLVGGHLAMFAGGVPWRRLVSHDTLDDVVFFALLFLMTGAVAASGILDGLGGALEGLWHRDPLWGALALAWSAAALTCFMSAGPTTALLLHLLPPAAGPVAWWALSLGVCAGSSGTLTGATAGPVAASLLEQHRYELSFNRFARTGLPLMMLFLMVTSIYILAWARWSG